MDTISVVRYAHEWSHPDTALVIHTYPTIHLESASTQPPNRQVGQGSSKWPPFSQ